MSKGEEGKARYTVLHITQFESKNCISSSTVSPIQLLCHDSSPLVSPPYRPLLSSLANGGTLNPWCGTCALDAAAPELYNPGLALFDCKACLVVVIPEPTWPPCCFGQHFHRLQLITSTWGAIRTPSWNGGRIGFRNTSGWSGVPLELVERRS